MAPAESQQLAAQATAAFAVAALAILWNFRGPLDRAVAAFADRVLGVPPATAVDAAVVAKRVRAWQARVAARVKTLAYVALACISGRIYLDRHVPKTVVQRGFCGGAFLQVSQHAASFPCVLHFIS